MGHVGLSTALGLAEFLLNNKNSSKSYELIALDTNQDLIHNLNKGILELADDSLTQSFVALRHHIQFVDKLETQQDCSIHLICVGTPSAADQSADLSQLTKCVNAITSKSTNKTHSLIIRSTVPVGYCKQLQSQVADNFEVYHMPEFLREGHAMSDFRSPSLQVLGATTKCTSLESVKSLFPSYNFTQTNTDESEMCKYVCNIFHALKASFANEIGHLSKAMNIDGTKIMQLVCSDTKLNISSAYMRPGFAFGGACLTKDISATLKQAQIKNVDMPIVASIQISNEHKIQKTRELLGKSIDDFQTLNKKAPKVAVIGLSFKPGTGDLRDSQIIKIFQDNRLLEKIETLVGYDEKIKPQELHKMLPKLKLSDSKHNACLEADILVLGTLQLLDNKDDAIRLNSKHIIDLAYFREQSIMLSGQISSNMLYSII